MGMPNNFISVSIDYDRLFSFKSLELKQSINEHHTFTLTLDPEISGKDRLHDLNDCTKWLGKTMTVHTGEDDEVIFVGIITNINLHKKESTLGCLVIKGYSTTYRLENAPSYHSWTDQTLASIVERLTTDAKVRAQINTEHKEEILYESQYNESDFGFIKRLAKQYGEWMYYDGKCLVFGKPKKEKAIELEYGTDLYTLDIGIQTLARPLKVLSYQARGDQAMAENSANRPDGQDELGYKAFNASLELFKTPSVQTAMPRIRYVQQLTDYAKKRQESTAAESHYIVARSGNPMLTVGSVVEVKSSLLENFKAVSTETLGEFIITEITHNVGEGNYYKNEFKAIPAGVRTLPEPNVVMPMAEPQMATVVSNDDPRGIGRVRVQMNWQSGNMSTSWIRVMTPDAGSSDKVNTNRGFVFIPEVGDKVLVGFRNGDPNRPYVMGSLFNGYTAAGGKVNNGIKSLTTRSGIEIRFDDNERSLHIKDASGNKVFLDGNGSVRIDALQNITLNAGKDMQLNVGRDLTVNVGNNQSTTIGNSSVTTVVQKLLVNTPFMEQVVADFFHTQAGQALINSQNLIKIEAPETNVVGEEKLFMHSAKETVVNSQGTAEFRGEQGMNHLNRSISYETAKTELDSDTAVFFQPSADYNGEFGFDWYRMGNSGIPGDFAFENKSEVAEKGKPVIKNDGIIGRHYTKNEKGQKVTADYHYKDKKGVWHESPFEVLQNSITHQRNCYERKLVPWLKKENKDGKTGNKVRDYEYTYFVPIMTIMDGVTAKLSAEIKFNPDKKDRPKEISIEFENDSLVLNAIPSILPVQEGKVSINIACNGEFDTEQTLIVKADDKVCGKIRILPNSKKYQREIKVVAISVMTRLSGTLDEEDIKKGQPAIGGFEFFQRILRQAQITIPDGIEELGLDCTDQKFTQAFKTEFKDGTGEMQIGLNSRKRGLMREYLEKAMNEQFGTKYKNHYKLFFFDELLEVQSGYSYPCSPHACFLRDHEVPTIIHEMCHCLGLAHTFDYRIPERSFIAYRYAKTNNILDYSHHINIPRNCLFYWQWKKINPYIIKGKSK